MDYPFSQIKKNNKLIRTFLPSVDTDELKWHQDLNDRKVKVLESGAWQFQMDNELPINLENGQIVLIPKLVWHRVIKGNDRLIVEIEEY